MIPGIQDEISHTFDYIRNTTNPLRLRIEQHPAAQISHFLQYILSPASSPFALSELSVPLLSACRQLMPNSRYTQIRPFTHPCFTTSSRISAKHPPFVAPRASPLRCRGSVLDANAEGPAQRPRLRLDTGRLLWTDQASFGHHEIVWSFKHFTAPRLLYLELLITPHTHTTFRATSIAVLDRPSFPVLSAQYSGANCVSCS